MLFPTSTVITVGAGRGFVLAAQSRFNDRVIITAAHCLPHFPPSMSFSNTEERTYTDLIGPLNEDPSVWAECLFVDPIADIAVLGEPDGQELPDEHEAYATLVDSVQKPLLIGEAPDTCPAWLLSLDGEWTKCTAQHYGGPLWLTDASAPIRGGMSGSPILSDDSKALGVVVASTAGHTDHREGGPSPRLTDHLPGWLVRAALDVLPV